MPISWPGVRLSDAEIERYGRQLILDGVGEEGQLRLARSRVLVIGAGALGSPVIMYLAGAGVGQVTVADDDVVDLSNLSRQVAHGEPDLGVGKASSAARSAARVNSSVRIVTLPTRLEGVALDASVAEQDLVCDATDNLESKFAINDACVRAGVPLVHAAVVGFGGQLLTVVPGGPCYRCLFGEDPGEDAVPGCAQAGILGPVGAVVGGMQAVEALKLLLGVGVPLAGRLLVYDGLAQRAREVSFPLNPDCRAAHARRDPPPEEKT
ncbi:MAG: HesA/MoeB/ThiF family protein [Candidatus Dormibacteria bacterium]